MKKLWFGLLFVPVMTFAQTCPLGQTWEDCSGPQFGPAPCVPGCRGEITLPADGPFGPGELCIAEVCKPVTYFWVGAKAVAESWLPNGYEVLGWSGPCLNENRSQCPDILNQAFNDLRTNALRANRAQGYRP
jgi:hypothetical protein